MLKIFNKELAQVRILLVDSAPSQIEMVRLALSHAAGISFEGYMADELAQVDAHLRTKALDVDLSNFGWKGRTDFESLPVRYCRYCSSSTVMVKAVSDDATTWKSPECYVLTFLVRCKSSTRALIRAIRFALLRRKYTAAATRYLYELKVLEASATAVDSDSRQSIFVTGEIEQWDRAKAHSELAKREAEQRASIDLREAQ